MRILLVEDEADLANAMARGLRREGLAVDIATDAVEGFVRYRRNHYDVIVLDREVRGGSGDELCRRVTADAGSSRVLMLSAQDGIADLASGYALGADDYLVKPFDFRDLVVRLRALDRPLLSSGC